MAENEMEVNPTSEYTQSHFCTCECDECLREEVEQIERELVQEDIEFIQQGITFYHDEIPRHQCDCFQCKEESRRFFGGDTGIDADFNPFCNMDDPDNYPDPDGVIPLGG